MKRRELLIARIEGRRNIVLADYGLCKNAAELQTQCGTTSNAASENFKDCRIEHYMAAIDIWSLGIVMYKILSILPKLTPKHIRHLEQNITELS